MRGYNFLKSALIGATILAITSFSNLYARPNHTNTNENNWVCMYSLPRYSRPGQNFEPKNKSCDYDNLDRPRFHVKLYEPRFDERRGHRERGPFSPPMRPGPRPEYGVRGSEMRHPVFREKPKMTHMQEFMFKYAPKFAPGSKAGFGPDFGIANHRPGFGMPWMHRGPPAYRPDPEMKGCPYRCPRAEMFEKMRDKMKERFGRGPPPHYQGYRHERPNKPKENRK